MNFQRTGRYIEYPAIFLLGVIIFGLLNLMMLQMNYDIWTSMHYGAYTAFHKGWELSGFDNTTYIAVATDRPLYVMMRHPLIMYFIWPMYEIEQWLEEDLKIYCSIQVVAVVWTIISAISWTVLYRIMRKIIELPWTVSLLLCFFYFSFAHVMLATFAPDHMILSMTLFLIMLYISAKAAKRGRQVSTWKSLVMTFLSTGISTTNFAKIWLIDICSMQEKVRLKSLRWWRKFILHGMLYFIPLAMVGGLYYYETENEFAEEESYAADMGAKFAQRNPEKARQDSIRTAKVRAENEAKQLGDSKLLQWTDFTLPLVPSIIENFLGESIQLHDKYVLRDSHRAGHRPDIVYYRHWYNYLIEGLVVFLLAIGLWYGRRERLMWMACAVFCFDCLLHLGFRFALNDVYIMAAHWAFIIPIAVGYAYQHLRIDKVREYTLLSIVVLLTIWLWFHNLTLTYNFIMTGFRV